MLSKLLSIASISLTMLVFPSLVSAQPSLILAQVNKLELNNLLLVGNKYVEEQNYDKALATYEQAADIDGENSQIFSGIGYVQTLRKNYVAAIAAYQQALKLAPNDPKLYYALGFCLGSLEKNLAAAEAYEQAIALEPDNLENYLGLGVVQVRAEHYDRAIETYKRSLF
ncbi:MAG: tetratricopeptide repeat protein [Hydrococcus sp. SU_1_0]|nr:tetratricopeptide repeat protein [Hydrococcus sp. SU_1_0]